MLTLVVISQYLKKQAAKNIENYFLGGRRIPWWALGVTGMAAWLDMTGTMIITSFLFMLGPRGLFIEFRGGACLVLTFCMLWLGKWHRRSGCMTGAEWMSFRFGNDKWAHGARIMMAISTIILVMSLLAYSFVGAGLFLSMFLPFPPWVCMLGLITITAVYTVEAGFFGVVVTDIFQMLLVIVSVIAVCFIAIKKMRLEGNINDLAVQITGNTQWMSSHPQLKTTMPKGYEAYNGLFVITLFYLAKIIIQGLGTGNEPRYFAARSDRECGLLSFLAGWLMSVRWLLMMGFVIIGLFLVRDLFPDQSVSTSAAALIKSYAPDTTKPGWVTLLADIVNHKESYSPQLIEGLKQLLGDDWARKLSLVSFEGTVDTERILPAVLLFVIPAGLRGLLVVALLAAAMSTFNAFINMATGFFTRDIYQAYIRPKAGNRELIYASYTFGVALVAAAFAMAVSSENINDIWGWLAMGLCAGLSITLMLRMYWWRFNGAGFAIGTLVGMAGAMIQRLLWPHTPEWEQFVILSLVGIIGSIIGTYITKPTDSAIIENYYRKVRPFGFWQKFSNCFNYEQQQQIRKENTYDLLALPFAFFWQVTILLLPMQLLIGSYKTAVVTAGILVVSLVGLYFLWYRRLHLLDEVLDS
jgi:Na+/proline symporter